MGYILHGHVVLMNNTCCLFTLDQLFYINSLFRCEIIKKRLFTLFTTYSFCALFACLCKYYFPFDPVANKKELAQSRL